MDESSSRDRLIRTASTLFRRRGYAGVGLNEILAAANLPKGSLYYHFPGGKRDLAEAATLWASETVERIIDASFAGASGFTEGTVAACNAVARLADREAGLDGCPVVSILLAGSQEPTLRTLAQQIFAGWIDRVAAHARRLAVPNPEIAAKLFVAQIQGAWILALAEQSTAAFATLEQSLRSAPV